MREESLFVAIRGALARTARSWFRVVQFSVQADHVHLIVEAADKVSLSRGVTGLSVRVARAFNAPSGAAAPFGASDTTLARSRRLAKYALGSFTF